MSEFLVPGLIPEIETELAREAAMRYQKPRLDSVPPSRFIKILGFVADWLPDTAKKSFLIGPAGVISRTIGNQIDKYLESRHQPY